MAETDQTLKLTKHGWKMVRVEESGVFDLQEPEWTDDVKFQACEICKGRFSFFVRRHHCRRCGKLLCGNCCNSKIELWRMGFIDPQLVCKNCLEFSQDDISLQKKTALFAQGVLLMVEEDGHPFGHVSKCFFDMNTGAIEYDKKLVSIGTVSDVFCRTTNDPISGKSVVFCIGFKAVTESGEKKLTLSVSAPEVENKKQSMDWLAGIYLALKILKKTVQVTPKIE